MKKRVSNRIVDLQKLQVSAGGSKLNLFISDKEKDALKSSILDTESANDENDSVKKLDAFRG